MSVPDEILREVYNRFQPRLDNPIVTATFYGVTSGVLYTYRVTAIGDTGETDGTTVTVMGSSDLNYDNYIVLEWLPVKNAKKYRVYGRRAGNTFGLLSEVYETRFVDYGVVPPDISILPPAENKTGRQNWESVVFLPGRGLQSSELNELQEILAFHQERLGRTLFKDGDIVSGCSITIDAQDKKAIIEDGKIFIRGRVREIKGAVLPIDGVGVEKIGILVTERYVDASEDSVLLDPAQNWPGYATAGALRKIIELSWVKDAPDMVVVYELLNGFVVKSFVGTQYSELEKRLAIRTDDIAGDVVVSGLNLSVFPHKIRRDKLVFCISGGKAYVSGFEVLKLDSLEWEEDTAKDTYTIQAEIVYPDVVGGYVYTLKNLPVCKVNSVVGGFFGSVSSVVPNVVDQSGWYVWDFPQFSIYQVIGVWNNANKNIQYQENTHYKVIGSSLRFNPSFFNVGAPFYVEYYYFRELNKGKRVLTENVDTFVTDGTTKVFVTSKTDVTVHVMYGMRAWLEDSVTGDVVKVYDYGKDYTIDLNRTSVSIGNASLIFQVAPSAGYVLKVRYWYWEHVIEGEYVSDDSYLDENDPYGTYQYEAIVEKGIVDLRVASAKPALPFLIVSYDFFLPQRAYVLLDVDGRVELLRGKGSKNPTLPVKPHGKLALYAVYIPAFASASEVIMERQVDYARFTVFDANRLRRRVEKLEYDLALTMEEVDALRKDTPSPKKVIFVDSFTDTMKMDIDASDVGMDSRQGTLLLPVSCKSDALSVLHSGLIVRSGKVFKPYTRAPWISQLAWTEQGLIELNPYGAFGTLATVDIYPSKDFWVEEKSVEEIAQHIMLEVGPRGGVTGLNVGEVRRWLAKQLKVDPSLLLFTGKESVSDDRILGYISFKQVIGEPVSLGIFYAPYLRQITVYFKLQSKPLLDFYVYFAGKQVIPTLANQSELNALKLGWSASGMEGSVANALRTDSAGLLVGKFVIPENVVCGEHVVLFKSIDGAVETTASFVGMGSVKEFKRSVKLYKVAVKKYSPLAQTFIAPEDGFIESVDFWFYAVPFGKDDAQVSLVVREVELGMPTNRVLGAVTKLAKDIVMEAGLDPQTYRLSNVSNLSENYGRVRFVFETPVFVQKGKEYAICLDDSEPGFVVFAARVGKRIIGDMGSRFSAGSILETQAHEGVALLSVNTRTWESLQDVDLMFRINRAVFDTTPREVYFAPISYEQGIGEMIVSAAVLVPAGTFIDWYWSKDGNEWYWFDPVYSTPEGNWVSEDNKVILGQLTTSLYLKCVLSNNADNASPMLFLDNVKVFGLWYENSGVYETKNIALVNETFENVKLWFWVKDNGGTVDAVRVSFDGGNTWYDVNLVNSYNVGGGFLECEYGGNVTDISEGALTSSNMLKLRIEYSSSEVYRSIELKKLRVVCY